jgi:predicted PhzF superfamily epimerase YddE/YHI9
MPFSEVPLCGHGTLSSAVLLMREGEAALFFPVSVRRLPFRLKVHPYNSGHKQRTQTHYLTTIPLNKPNNVQLVL